MWLPWILWTIALGAFLGAVLIFGRWALRHLEISVEVDGPSPVPVSHSLKPFSDLVKSEDARNFALTRTVLTDVMHGEGASTVVTTLSREELQLVVIGAGGFLAGCMEVLGARYGKSGPEFWSGFCMSQELPRDGERS